MDEPQDNIKVETVPSIQGGGGLVNHIRRSYSLSDLADDPDLKSDLNRNSKLLHDNTDSPDVPRDSRRTPRKTVGSHVDLYFPEMDVDIRTHPHEIPVSLGQIRSSEDISSGYSSSGEGQAMEAGNPLMRTASVGGARTRGRGGRVAAPAVKKTLISEEREEDVMDDIGLQHALHPFPITTLYPELLNLDANAFPQNALLTPEALQIIFTNSIYRRNWPTNLYETEELRDEDECLKNNLNENETQNILYEITEPKEEKNIELAKEIENSNEKNNESYNDLDTKDSAFEDTSFSIEPNEIHMTETKSINFEKENLNLVPTTYTTQEKDQPFQEDIEQNECFEDACDDTIIPALNSRVNLNENGLKQSMSEESLASSGEPCFEDSLPDIGILDNYESSETNERRGKYNKVRAPAPPDHKVLPGESLIEGTEISHESIKSDTLLQQMNETTSYFNPKVKEEIYEPTILKGPVSPSLSQKNKKDASSSNFSRFLPKSSLFSIFGGREDIHSSKRSSNLSRTPSNASLKSGQIYLTGNSNSIPTSNIEYQYDSNDRLSRKDESMSSPKLRLRQMSQSPSQRKYHD